MPVVEEQSEKVLPVGEFTNDTIAADCGKISQRRVRDSDNVGSVGREKSAEEVRNGHDAMRMGGDGMVSVVPEGS